MSEKGKWWPNDIKVERDGEEYWISELWEDKKRLEFVLSWAGQNFLDAWMGADNTVPPTREDVDKAMEEPHE